MGIPKPRSLERERTHSNKVIEVSCPEDIGAVDFSPCSTKVAIGGRNKKISLHTVTCNEVTGTCDTELWTGDCESLVYAVSYSTTNKIAAGCKDGRVIIFNALNGKREKSFQISGPVFAL